MSPRLRLVAAFAAALLLSSVTLVAIAFAALFSPAGQKAMGEVVQKVLSSPGQTATIDDFHFGWPFVLSARQVTVADGDGVWLVIEAPEISWRPTRLLDGVVAVDRVEARRVDVLRTPRTPSTPSRFRLSDILNFPFTIRVGRISVPVNLRPPILGEAAHLYLDGHFRTGEGGSDVCAQASDGSSARLTGSLDKRRVDLRWTATVPELAYWRRLAGTDIAGRLTTEGSISGVLPGPAIAGRAELRSLRIDTVGWERATFAVRAQPNEGKWAGTVSADVFGARWGGKAALPPKFSLRAAGDVVPATGRIRLASARLHGDGAVVSAFGIAWRWGRESSLVVKASVNDLQRLAGGELAIASPYKPSPYKRLALTTYVSGDMVARRIAAMIGVEGDGGARLRALVTVAGKTVRLAGARAEAREGTAWAAGRLWPSLGLWANGALPDLSVVDKRVSGKVGVDARLSGPAADPDAWGAARFDGLRAASLPPANGTLSATLLHLGRGGSGSVAIEFRQGAHKISGSAQTALGREIRLGDMRLQSGEARITGALIAANGRLRGGAVLSVPHLSQWQDISGMAMTGGLEASVAFDPANDQSLRFQARANGLGLSGTRIRSAEMRAVASHLLGRPMVDATITAAGVRSGVVSFTQASARAVGRSDRLRLTLEGHGTAELTGEGTLRGGQKGSTLLLDAFSLTASGHSLRLLGPAQVSWGAETIRLSPLRVGFDQGVIEARGERNGRRISASLRLDRLPLAPVDLVYPDLKPAGIVSGTASLDGSTDNPRARVTFTGTGLGVEGMPAGGGMDASIDGTWQAGRAKWRAMLREAGKLSADAEGSVPLILGRGPLFPPSGAISGHMAFSGDLSFATAMIPMGTNSMKGAVSGDFRVAGTIGTPLLSGTVQIADGHYENFEYGTVISGLDVSARLDGDLIMIHGQGIGGGNGTVSLNGQARLGGLRPSYEVAMVLANFRAIRRDDVTATLSGTLNLRNQQGRAAIAGNLTVDRAEIDISRLPGAGSPTLKVININQPKGEEAVPKAPPVQPPLPGDTALAVTVNVAHAFVRGQGLDSEWQGNLKVGGNAADPTVTGRLSPVRGRYELLGHAFKFQPESAIVFLGGTPIDPQLDITAQATARDIVAIARVTGTARKPKIDFRSEPPLPKEEILARVLFGSEFGKLSVFQQIQLARLAASGLGIGGGGNGGGIDPLAHIRNALGLDVIEMGGGPQGAATTPGAKEAPTLSLGKYVGPDTFVRVDQGLQGLGSVTVEQDITRGFSITTSVGQQIGEAVGINWHYDY